MEKLFIDKNKKFWSDFSVKESNKKILIVETSIPMIIHANGIFSLILNQAKSLTPVWLCDTKTDPELLKSYVKTAKIVSIPKFSWNKRIKTIFMAIWNFIVIYITRDILSFSYDGIKYGDIVYDSYLLKEQIATIRKINIKLLGTIYSCIRRHEVIRKILSSDNFEAVMVDHQVGIYSGVMLRTALRYGYKGYLRAGHHQSTLQCFERLDEVHDYEYKPFPENLDILISKLGPEFDKTFNLILNKQVSGRGSKDAIYAFSPNNKYYTDRESFNRDFGLNPKKKNIFMMLHALNDHPHAFMWMIFKDYYDWFTKTLEFAKKHDTVNWIFIQHPSIRFYTTKDVSFDSLFSDNPDHIKYVSEANQIDTRSLIYCADLVVTCLGSAGFELPAMARIPSVTAGDNFYTGLGFVLEPKTEKEYFEILDNVENIGYLTSEQQKRAKAAYMFIYEFSKVCVSACPPSTLEEEKDKNQQSWYWNKVMNLYEAEEKTIKEQIQNYIREVIKPDFKRLNSLEGYCLLKNDIVESCVKR